MQEVEVVVVCKGEMRWENVRVLHSSEPPHHLIQWNDFFIGAGGSTQSSLDRLGVRID